MNAKNPRGPVGLKTPRGTLRGRRLSAREIPSAARARKQKHVRGLDLVLVDTDHLGHRLRVRSRRKGLSGRQWKKLYKAVQRELKRRAQAKVEVGLMEVV